MRDKGLFITFEGIDGCGKTTHLNLIKKDFELVDQEVVMAKEPGDTIVDSSTGQTTYVGSNIGAQIRHLLFTNPTTKDMAPGVADMLFLADHIQVTEKVIKPAVADGKIVLCDRYVDSELAYAACYEKRVPAWAIDAWIKAFDFVPDITVLLLGDPTVFADRCKSRGGAEAQKQAGKAWANVEAQRKVQETYISNLGQQHRTILIDITNKSISQVHEYIWDEIYKRIMNDSSTPQQLELPFRTVV